MNAKKCLVFLLSVLLLLPMLALPAFAAGDPVLDYEVTIDGLEVKEAEPGDIVTVTLYLQRTDSDQPYTMLAMQSELRYDSSFFELVEDSIHLYDGVQYSDIARETPYREFYMNFLSFSGGVEWQARTRVGSFQLRVIGTEGTSTITNEDFLVSNPKGSGGYECSSNELTVVLTADCTVKFESNGGSKIDPVNAIYGETIDRPADPVRAGKEFVGWFKDIHQTEEWDFETDTVKGSMTLYAKWADAAVEPSDPGQTDEPVPSDPVESGKPEPSEPVGERCDSCGREAPSVSGNSLCGQCRMLRTLIALAAVLIGLMAVVVVCLLVLLRGQRKKETQKTDPAYLAAESREG